MGFFFLVKHVEDFVGKGLIDFANYVKMLVSYRVIEIALV